MLRNPLSTFDHKYFFSINDRDDPQTIDNFWAQNIENWLIRNVGELVMRPGLTARGASPAKTNLGSGILYLANGTKKFVRVVNGAANTSKFQASDDGTTWVDISGGGSKTTGAIWVLEQANNAMYGVNGNDTPIKYDGSSVTTVVAIPQGTAIHWWKNHMWVIGNPTFKDRLYFSNPNDPETWTGSDYINVNLGDTSKGVGIRGTGGSTGRLMIGKERSVWFITGSAAANWVLSLLTYEHGVASHESMIPVKNDVWAVDLEGNIRGLYRTAADNPFSALKSNEIQTTIASVNRAAITKSTAVWFNNYALFFVPYGVNDYNSIVLVWDTLANQKRGGWLKFTNWNVARATVFAEGSTPKLFLHDARSGNGQTYEWIGTSDNGTSITAKYETKIYDLGFPAQEKRFRFSYFFAPALGSGNVRWYSSIDRFYYVLLETISLAGTGNKLLGVNWTLGVDKLGSGGFIKEKVPYSAMGGETRGTTFQIKIEAESTILQIKVRPFTTHFRLRGLR